MGKTLRGLGFGLLIGAAAGHYFSTEKGKETLAKLKEEYAVFSQAPALYKETVVKRVKTAIAENIQVAYDHQEDIMAMFATEEDAQATEEPLLAAEVDDIVIAYDEDDLS